MEGPFELSVVIPAFNESRRLPRCLVELDSAHALGELPPALEAIVVDDGSTDDTADVVLRRQARTRYPLRLVRLPRNQGKGAAVRTGMDIARGAWILMSDADASTPFNEYRALRAAGADGAIASRGLPGSRITIRQPGLRHPLGAAFNLLVRRLSGLPFRDTQCGFKLVSRTAWQAVHDQLAVDGFAWDIEFLMALRRAGFRIAEVPVEWEHREDSRVKLSRDGPQMIRTVLGLRRKFSRSGAPAERAPR